MESTQKHTDPEQLDHVVEHLSHYLPTQGPIGVFVHHNTLHAFQHLLFEEAVVAAAKTFGAQPYLAESDYRQAYARGRIRLADVEDLIDAEGQDTELRRVMLVPGVRDFRAETIHWEIAENGIADAFRLDLPIQSMRAIHADSPREVFNFWYSRTPMPQSRFKTPARPRVGILEAHGIDLDTVIHPELIKMAGAFLDQGLAYWPMPNRQDGFWAAALKVFVQPPAVQSNGLKHLPHWVRQWSKLDAKQAVEAAIEVLGVEPGEVEAFLKAEFLALPGWAGMFRMLEVEPYLAPHERVPARVMDFLAVRLLLTVAAVHRIDATHKQWRKPLLTLPADPEACRLARASKYFDAGQLAGYSLARLRGASASEIEAFEAAVDAFDDFERRRVWHLAYERRHERQILLPLRAHAAASKPEEPQRVAAQVFFCIDEREESLRRHLEEHDPSVETFGAAGFFGVAMNYTGIDDAVGSALCPVVVKPGHRIVEGPAEGQEETHSRRKELRRMWAKVARTSFISSRTLVRGWLGTSLLGIFSVFPLAGRVLSPRRYSQFAQWLNSTIFPEPRTELAYMRKDDAGHKFAQGLLPGYTIQEKVEIVSRVLGPAGLRKTLARLVVVLGHGSTTVNNPHESAYDCGACGGRRGGPNARLFALMANHPEVRAGLRQKDIYIPEDTWFVGGYHDTCSDNIDLFDLQDLPESHRGDLARLRASLDEARARSAHERTRRFSAQPDIGSVHDALHHVQERSEHIAEPRPEYGHGTNAVTIVGRRSTTRGLFLDRRAFLVSYDATQDPTNAGLAAVLGAVIPVCGGISLEYYFSTVDNEKYGCGTKLPHNVSGLLGVMNGYESDLRTGLALQTVEIHEPVRSLFVVETTPERLYETVRANPICWEFLNNRWIRLAVMDPEDGTRILVYRGDNEWEPISGGDEKLHYAPSSIDWYRDRHEHLPVACIAPVRDSREMAVR